MRYKLADLERWEYMLPRGDLHRCGTAAVYGLPRRIVRPYPCALLRYPHSSATRDLPPRASPQLLSACRQPSEYFAFVSSEGVLQSGRPPSPHQGRRKGRKEGLFPRCQALRIAPGYANGTEAPAGVRGAQKVCPGLCSHVVQISLGDAVACIFACKERTPILSENRLEILTSSKEGR